MLLPTAAQTSRLAACLAWLRLQSRPSVLTVNEALDSELSGYGERSETSLLRQRSGSEWRNAHTAVVLPGSFNPLHVAHLMLLTAAARAVPRRDTAIPLVAALSLSVHTIDKVQPSGMALEDRAWTMYTSIKSHSSASCPAVALIASHGLYLDQASALHDAMPDLQPDGLWFAIGHDKAVQIFDARYYDDRDTALEALFEGAGLLVAPRAGATSDDIGALTRHPDNRRFADRVRPITLPTDVSELSSTAIRSGSAAPGDLPGPVAAMVRARHCYG